MPLISTIKISYAEGLYISLNHDGTIPKGTKIRLYVGNKYDNNDLVNVYYYDKDNLEKIVSGLKVINGYIVFEVEKPSDYLITMSDIKSGEVEEPTSGKITYKHILLIVIGILLLVFGIIFFIKKKKDKEKDNSLNNNSNDSTYNFTNTNN